MFTKIDSTIEAHDLDDAIELGTADSLIGAKAYNGGYIKGTVVKLRNGEIAIRARILCNKCRKRKHTVYMVSGLHKGAFCYTTDINGNHTGNLRDQVVVCEKC